MGGSGLSGRVSKYPEELREQAVRMVAEVRPQFPPQWAAITAVAGMLRIGTPETLRTWIRRSEVDSGQRPGVWCRLYPGRSGVDATDQVPWVAACRFPAASSMHPGTAIHLSGAHFDETSSAVHSRTPVRPSPHPQPSDVSGTASAFALSSHLARYQQRTSGVGTGQRTHTRATSSTTPPTST